MPAKTPLPVVAPNTAFIGAVRDLLTGIEASFAPSFQGVVRCYLVGGCAAHIYTAHRTSGDMDAKFEPGIVLPETPVANYVGAEGQVASLMLDRNYSDVFGVMHPDWQQDARPWERFGRLRAYVISPLDLAVSKVSRFQDNDRLDIMELASAGLIAAPEFEQRCTEAMDYYVGDLTFVKYNIREAVELIRQCTPSPRKP